MIPRREDLSSARDGSIPIESLDDDGSGEGEVTGRDSGRRGVKRILSLTQWILVPLILLAGIGAFSLMIALREEPQQQVQEEYSPLVSVITTSIGNQAVDVRGNGAVTAQTRVDLVPQVGGRIIRIHPALRAGGKFSADEVLLEIEPIDYELTVVQAGSEVAAAKRRLEQERAEAESALEEWALMHPGEAAPELVARIPQILEAEANVKAAEARLRLAEINLERTKVSMSFDGRVIDSKVDVGEVVPPNVSVGMVYSNEIFEVPVPLEFDQLSWIGAASDGVAGSPAVAHTRIAGTQYEIPGEVVRIESELDSMSRLARAIVQIEAEDIPASVRDKVIPGLFVDVSIGGESLDAVTALPRSVMRENQTVWLVEDERLIMAQPEILYESAREVLVRGIPEDSLIITSQLEVVTQGMKVRTREASR